MQKLLDKRYIKLYNTHVTKVTPCGPLAQLAEHLTFNQGVPRSSRGWITIFFALFKKNKIKKAGLKIYKWNCFSPAFFMRRKRNDESGFPYIGNSKKIFINAPMHRNSQTNATYA